MRLVSHLIATVEQTLCGGKGTLEHVLLEGASRLKHFDQASNAASGPDGSPGEATEACIFSLEIKHFMRRSPPGYGYLNPQKLNLI